MFIGRTDVEAETPILWPPDVKNWLIRKDPDVGKDWRQEEKRTAEDEMVGWHHQLNGHEFEQAPGVEDRQGSLVCCSPWGHKESNTTEQVNWLVRGLKARLWKAWSKGLEMISLEKRSLNGIKHTTGIWCTKCWRDRKKKEQISGNYRKATCHNP